jgi:putative FmdB family regulatory protein
MPTYEYICGNCGYEFEQFQSITAKPLRKCPECRKANLKRLIGCGSGVIFKGSGFYETDYRSEGYKKGEKSEKSAGEKKTEAKKTEAKDSKPVKKDKSSPTEKK